MADDVPLIDQYSGLDHKLGMSADDTGGIDAAPKYLPDADKRRVNAYARLSAYLRAVARLYLRADPDDPEKAANWREFGDPAVVARQIATSILGEDPAVVVDDADKAIPDAPDIPEAPTEPDTSGREPAEARILTEVWKRRLELWERNATTTLELWQADTAAAPLIEDRQRWLREWADKEQLIAKITEAEREMIVPLGDGVYVLGWDHGRSRVRVEIMEPDAYVPVLNVEPGEYPTKVHLVWQFDEAGDDGKPVRKVRRITYELLPLEGLEGFDTGPAPLYLEEGQTASHVCVLSDGTWELTTFEKTAFDAMAEGVTWRKILVDGAEVELNQYPLGLDFIPVVHVPHNLSTQFHFGRSPLTDLAQLWDELAAADTDEALAATWAARPPFGVSGMGATGSDATLRVVPGQAWKLADNGRITAIDMALHLEKLGARIAALLKRSSVNASVPEGIMGRVDASQVPSGLALTLSFTSFKQNVEGARLVRNQKYRLLLKMVQRIAIQNRDETLAGSTVVYPAGIRFGTFMPQDLAGGAATVAQLFAARLISQETALIMLQEMGVPSGDLSAELAAIRATMGAEADLIATATGSTALAGEFLGYTAEELAGPEGAPVAVPGGAVTPAATPVQ